MIARALAAVLLLGLVGGCGSDDPFTADMKMICSAGGGRDDLPPEMRKLAAMKQIAENVKTAEAARLVAEVMQAAPSERDELLRPALAKAGLKRCPTLER
jgi:hypothetical protein